MTPERRAEALTLANDIQEDLRRVATVYESIEKNVDLLQKDDSAFGEVPREVIVQATASYIHNFYAGVEQIYERIIVFTAGERPTGENSHQQILEIAHKTHLLTDPDENKMLNDLRGFHHVFRKAYGLEMDPKRVESKAKEICLRWAGLGFKINDFLKQLRQNPPGQIRETN